MSDDLHALVGAYVMDALDDDERDAFEAFMATSRATADEVNSLREVTAILASGAAETPPEGLRKAVMAKVDTTRQLPPVVSDLSTARSMRPLAAPPTAPPASHQSWAARTGTRLMAVAAVLSLVAALALGTALVSLSDRLNGLEETNSQVATLLASQDASRHEGDLPDGGMITALISDEHGTAVAVANGLPLLDEQQMYALWGLANGQPVPVGELVNGRPLTIHSAGLEQLALTVEPRGDLTLPTGTVQLTLGA